MNDPQISKGNFSNRKYIGLASKLDNNNLTKPSILIKEKDGSEFKLIFDEMSPLYDVFFVKEDKYGNSYFVFYYDDSLKPLQIHKYSPELKIVEKIVNLPYLPIHNGFPTIKPYIIDDYGNIYFMDLNKDGINILKWSHLQN
jgi:hypothetical protein